MLNFCAENKPRQSLCSNFVAFLLNLTTFLASVSGYFWCHECRSDHIKRLTPRLSPVADVTTTHRSLLSWLSSEHTLLTKMSSPSSLSPSAMSHSPASGSSAAGKGGGFLSELAAIVPVVRVTDVDGSRGRGGSWEQTAAATPAGDRATRQANSSGQGRWQIFYLTASPINSGNKVTEYEVIKCQ